MGEQGGAGYTAKLRAAGMTALELREQDMPLEELKAAGYSLDELKGAGYTLSELRLTGFTAGELIAAGCSVQQLRASGYTVMEMSVAGCTLEQLQMAGFDAKEVASTLNLSAADLLASGAFSASDLKAGGFSLEELRGASLSVADLRALGFQARALKQANISLSELLEGGFEAAELYANGALFSAAELRAAGMGTSELLGLGARAVAAMGLTASELAAMGVTAEALASEYHFEAAALHALGYSLRDLKACGFSHARLKRCGLFSADDFSEAGFSDETRSSSSMTARPSLQWAAQRAGRLDGGARGAQHGSGSGGRGGEAWKRPLALTRWASEALASSPDHHQPLPPRPLLSDSEATSIREGVPHGSRLPRVPKPPPPSREAPLPRPARRERVRAQGLQAAAPTVPRAPPAPSWIDGGALTARVTRELPPLHQAVWRDLPRPRTPSPRTQWGGGWGARAAAAAAAGGSDRASSRGNPTLTPRTPHATRAPVHASRHAGAPLRVLPSDGVDNMENATHLSRCHPSASSASSASGPESKAPAAAKALDQLHAHLRRGECHGEGRRAPKWAVLDAATLPAALSDAEAASLARTLERRRLRVRHSQSRALHDIGPALVVPMPADAVVLSRPLVAVSMERPQLQRAAHEAAPPPTPI